MTMIKNLTKAPNSKYLFLIDGAGALLSAIMLGGVFVQWPEITGLPIPTLYILAFFPILFLLYDLFFFMYAQKMALGLKGIAVLNISYCFLSIYFAFIDLNLLTLFGKIYIVSEIIIILYLVRIELRISKNI